MHIAVSGNIGAGKTTLTALLAKHYGWEPHYEDVDENPYLKDFYENMKRWSFALQIHFLNSRFNQVKDIRESGKDIIQDRTVYEDACIFAPNLESMDLMPTRDFETYLSLFNIMSPLVEAPDLLIYLRANISTLVEHIQERGRECENTIRLDYLKKLNERYEAWIENYTNGKLLIIDVDNLDFRNNKQDLNSVITKIDAHLNGLF